MKKFFSLYIASILSACMFAQNTTTASVNQDFLAEFDSLQEVLTASGMGTNLTHSGADFDLPEAEESIVDEMTGKSATPDGYGMKRIKKGPKVFNVADIDDVSKIYREKVNKQNTFFVVSKKEFRLYVYEVVEKDTLLAAHFPVCYAKYPEGKQKTGDMRTPDCDMEHAFKISQIQDASGWKHDFKDGRGAFAAYGHWFMRLNLQASNNPATVKSNRTIGIHGSSGNEESVPGRDSEGCIRLRDGDLNILKNNYAQTGTKVVVMNYMKGKMPFEIRAEKNTKGYQAPKPGNPLCKKYPIVK